MLLKEVAIKVNGSLGGVNASTRNRGYDEMVPIKNWHPDNGNNKQGREDNIMMFESFLV